MKRRHAMTAALALGAALTAGGAWAQNATADEAMAMVKKGVASFKANGRDKTLAEINNTQGSFRVRDLYLTVYRLDGLALAHGANQKMVGLQLIDAKDVDGKEFYRERMEMAKTKGIFWQDYKFTNPVTKRIEPKSMYCERLDDIVVCGGVYK